MDLPLKKVRVLTLLLFALTGCQQNIQQYPFFDDKQEVLVEGGQYDASKTFISPSIKLAPFSSCNIRSWKNKKNQKITHQLYIHDIYNGDWKFWNAANDNKANPLEFVSIEQKVIACGSYTGCALSETFGVMIPRKLLSGKSTEDFCVKIYAKSGDSKVICVPNIIIKKQLEAIKKTL